MSRTYELGKNPAIENLWLKFFEHPQGKWIMKLPESLRLYDLVKEMQPAQILELGTGIGCSTAVMASALTNGRITTVDSSKKCTELAKDLIPYELKQKIHFQYAPATVMKPIEKICPFHGWSAYADFMWVDWDLFIIDGPGPFLIAQKLKSYLVDLPNGDIITLLPRMKAGAKIFIQGRKEAVVLYERFFWNYIRIIENTEHYTIFQRTNKTLDKELADFENSDMTYQKLLKAGYWK